LHPAPDDKLTETAALIHDLAMQREEFRAEMDERPRLIVPGEDHGRAFRVVKTPGQDAILQPPKPRLLPRPRSSSSPQNATLNRGWRMTTADRVTVDAELTGSGRTHISTRIRTVGGQPYEPAVST
jgi:hypothetical protein